jgi:hypothetical protein
LGSRYRKWKYGRSVLFNMYFTPSKTVLKLGTDLGLKSRLVVPAAKAGNLEGALYFFQKPGL